MLTVAFATSDGAVVDQYFGWCRRFDVYQVSAERFELCHTRHLAPADADEEKKIDSRLDAVRDCAILNICDIGGSAAAKVINAGVHPVKVVSGTPITEVLARLQTVLRGTPPPWLRKVLRVSGASR